ncbi:MAG: 30S ribosomal protein S9 [Candidatus Aenigmarchaeota archaeon]|nr:30S ribosomal protein S9 [Candidatus Aenigmarchaeota archaeon]
MTKKDAKKERGDMVVATGKRKRAIARARITPGSGSVKINSIPLDIFPNEIFRLRVREPLILSGDKWKSFDIEVNVQGGGPMGQADAARQSIAKGLLEFDPELREKFIAYDRNLIAYDPRRTEPHKPPRSSQGPRRHKQRSKR